MFYVSERVFFPSSAPCLRAVDHKSHRYAPSSARPATGIGASRGGRANAAAFNTIDELGGPTSEFGFLPQDLKITLPVSMPTVLNTDLGSVMNAPACGLQPKKTHIVCTLGPSSCEVPDLVKLLEEGMSVARFNFSHGS